MASPVHVGELTPRQREVLDLLARGLSNGEIAERLGISLDGAKWHVRELIGKFGVSSRDEVADAWEAQRRHNRRAWTSGIATLGTLKVAAGVAAVAVVGSASVVAIQAAASGSDGEDGAKAQVVASATVSASATPAAEFSESEARAIAEREADRILAEKLDDVTVTPVRAADLRLDSVEWIPGITMFQSDDPDRYWDPEDGVARNVWRFRWSLDGVATVQPEMDGGRLEVDILIRDGSTGEALAAQAILTSIDGALHAGGGGGWRSHSQEEMIYRITTPAAPGRTVAWLNGQEGAARLELFPNLDGNWCMRTVDANGDGGGSGGCQAPGVDLWQKLHVPLEFSYDPISQEFGPGILQITCAPETVRLVVTRSDGQVLEFPVSDPIEAVPVRARFAYLDIGTMPEWFTVESYDAAGNLLGETKLGTANFSPAPPPPGP